MRNLPFLPGRRVRQQDLQAMAAMAALGSADALLFILRRRSDLFAKSKGRAFGSLAGLGLWSALAVSSSLAAQDTSDKRLQGLTAGLAKASAGAGVALWAVHMAIRKGRLRSSLAAGLGVACALLAVRD